MYNICFSTFQGSKISTKVWGFGTGWCTFWNSCYEAFRNGRISFARWERLDWKIVKENEFPWSSALRTCLTSRKIRHKIRRHFDQVSYRLSMINLYGLINECFYCFSTTNEDILKDWAEIRNTANEILGDSSDSPVRARVPLAGKSQGDRRQVQTAWRYSSHTFWISWVTIIYR